MAFPIGGTVPEGIATIEFQGSIAANFGSVLIGASELTHDDVLTDMGDTLVNRAIFTVGAGPPLGLLAVADAAVVRTSTVPSGIPGTRNAFVIDFQRMRTVSHLNTGDLKTYRVFPWLGTEFRTQPIYNLDTGSKDAAFAEVQTERLLVVTDPTTIDKFLEETSLDLPAPPTDLELLVNGKRVWFRPGAVRPDPGAGGLPFQTEVDLSGEIQAAVDQGASTITVTLKSATPGLLSLTHAVDKLRVHRVLFPEGEVRTVVAEAEGLTKVALPVPAAASSWTIHEVRMTVAGEIPATRVQPASGPQPAEDIAVTLDPERAALVRLPSQQLDAFANLHGVRIQVAVGPAGAEVAGVLRGDAGGEPGEILDGPSLGPLSLEAFDLEEPRFLSLLLPRPRKLEKLTPLWVAIQVSRGTLVWLVAVPDAGDDPPNPIRRGLPAGPFRPLPAVPEIAPDGLSAMIRVVGESTPDAPIAPLDAWVGGSTTRTELVPTAEGRPVRIGITPPISGSDPLAVFEGALQVQLRAATPATFSFRGAKIIYG